MTMAPLPPPPSERGSNPATDALLAGVLRKLLGEDRLALVTLPDVGWLEVEVDVDEDGPIVWACDLTEDETRAIASILQAPSPESS